MLPCLQSSPLEVRPNHLSQLLLLTMLLCNMYQFSSFLTTVQTLYHAAICRILCIFSLFSNHPNSTWTWIFLLKNLNIYWSKYCELQYYKWWFHVYSWTLMYSNCHLPQEYPLLSPSVWRPLSFNNSLSPPNSVLWINSCILLFFAFCCYQVVYL